MPHPGFAREDLVKNIHLFAGDRSGHVTEWQQVGTWTVAGDPGLPELVSVSPASGAGSSRVFTVTMRDGDGATDIWWNQLNINAGLNGYNACYMHYDPSINVFWLLNDNGTEWYGLFGGLAGQVQNSQCILRGAGSSGTRSGTDVTVTYDLQFKPGFSGAKDIFLLISDRTGRLKPLTRVGGWTAQ